MYTQIEFAVNVMIDRHVDMPASRHFLIADRYELGEKLSSTALGNVFHAHDFISADENESLRQVIMFAVEPQIVTYPHFYDVMTKIIEEFSRKNPLLQVIGACEDQGIYWIIIDEPYQELLINKLANVRSADPTLAMDNLRPLLLKTLDAVKQLRSKHGFGFIEPGAILCMNNAFKLVNLPVVLALRVLIAIDSDQKPTLALHSRYCSPQVAHGLLPTSQDDTFAIGCIAYHVLHGAPPFAELTTLEAYAQHKTPHSLTYLNPESQKSLQRALALERYERQLSPYELVHAFISVPVENLADDSSYISHIHHPATITVSLALVLLLGLGIYQTYQQPEIFLTAPASITTTNQHLSVTFKPSVEPQVDEHNILTTATSPESPQTVYIQTAETTTSAPAIKTTPKPTINQPITTPNAATLAANARPKPATQPVTNTTSPRIKAPSPTTEKPTITHTNFGTIISAPKTTVAPSMTTPPQTVSRNPQPAVVVIPVAENTFIVGQKPLPTIAPPQPTRKVKTSPADSANEHIFIVVSD